MAVSVEKVPLHWDSKGHILKWAKGAKPVKNVEGKQAIRWSEDTERVLLWVYTYPQKNWERIPRDKLTAKHGVFCGFGSADIENKIRSFSLGKLAKRDVLYQLVSYVIL